MAAGPGYTGHVEDPDTGLVYMQQRYYDSSMGRFLSVDPIAPAPGQASNFNRYTYAGNNPIDNIDPDGRADCPGQDRSKCVRSDAGAAADLRATEAQKAAASDNMAKVETRVRPEKVLALVGTSDVTVQAISGKQIYIPGKKDGVSVTNMPSGSAILHSHIDGKTPGRSSDGFVSPGDAIHTLRNGVVNFVVSERRLAVYQIVDGRIQINVLKGAFTGREANLLEKSINAQQPYVDAARPR
ncbi:RHS repeat-associated core domain-containing protein [Frateuria sp. MAH-13]|uniref:RHS repeat-associated core domain-containing protein n=1 Tax=Frateuria flava TaxID=2821489 RepID=A0ABS4DQ85_9GAMM|nr:RHS repeat-associated core domain-containing protein [Frateuria flava]